MFGLNRVDDNMSQMSPYIKKKTFFFFFLTSNVVNMQPKDTFHGYCCVLELENVKYYIEITKYFERRLHSHIIVHIRCNNWYYGNRS